MTIVVESDFRNQLVKTNMMTAIVIGSQNQRKTISKPSTSKEFKRYVSKVSRHLHKEVPSDLRIRLQPTQHSASEVGFGQTANLYM